MDHHIFHCTLGFPLDGGEPQVRVVSEDESVRTTVPATAELLLMFQSGEHKIRCSGYWDNEHQLVWLGNKLDD